MKIVIKNEDTRTSDYEVATKIATGLLAAGYSVSIGKEKVKTGNQFKNYWIVNYKENASE